MLALRHASRSSWLPAALAALSLAGPARAAPRPYVFAQGYDGLPEGGLDLESWFGASKPQAGATTWDWWIGPTVGLNDRVEAGFFAVLVQTPQGAAGTALALSALRPFVSVQLADKGALPVDLRLRGEVALPTGGGGPTTAWITAIAARDFGRVNVTANLSYSNSFGSSHDKYVTGELGASVLLGFGLRAGVEAELLAELSGPSALSPALALAWANSRLWASVSVGPSYGEEAPSRRGRIIVGMAF